MEGVEGRFGRVRLVAERPHEGSRGLQPTESGRLAPRRGATPEGGTGPVTPSVARRRRPFPALDRGLKSTATIKPSLREARAPVGSGPGPFRRVGSRGSTAGKDAFPLPSRTLLAVARRAPRTQRRRNGLFFPSRNRAVFARTSASPVDAGGGAGRRQGLPGHRTQGAVGVGAEAAGHEDDSVIVFPGRMGLFSTPLAETMPERATI